MGNGQGVEEQSQKNQETRSAAPLKGILHKPQNSTAKNAPPEDYEDGEEEEEGEFEEEPAKEQIAEKSIVHKEPEKPVIRKKAEKPVVRKESPKHPPADVREIKKKSESVIRQQIVKAMQNAPKRVIDESANLPVETKQPEPQTIKKEEPKAKNTPNPPHEKPVMQEKSENRVTEKLRQITAKRPSGMDIKNILLRNQGKIWAIEHFSNHKLSNNKLESTPSTTVGIPFQKTAAVSVKEHSKREFKFPSVTPQLDIVKKKTQHRTISYTQDIPTLSDKVLLEDTLDGYLGFSKYEHRHAPLVKLNFPPPINPNYSRATRENPYKQNAEPTLPRVVSEEPREEKSPAFKNLLHNPLSIFLKNINGNPVESNDVVTKLLKKVKGSRAQNSKQFLPSVKNQTLEEENTDNLHKMSPYAPYIVKSILENRTTERKTRGYSVMKGRKTPVVNQTLNATINIGEINEYPYK